MSRLLIVAVSATALFLVVGGCVPPASGDDGDGPTPNDTARESRLVETSWLNDHLGDAGLVVIDARTTDDYLAGHIPGSVSASFGEEDAVSRGYNVSYGCGLDFFLDADNAIPFQDGPPQQIQEAVRNFGIHQDDTVVVYDAGLSFHAGRFFWTLTHHGFDEIYILDGGLRKWQADGYPISTEIPTITTGNFTAAAPDVTLLAVTDDVFAAMSDPDMVIVSGLQPSWHYGSYTAYTIPGHIPTTQLMSLGYFFHSDGTWKSEQEMQMILDTVGITPDRTVITYCGGGPLSACMYFTFKHVLDYPDVRNYAGSYLAWSTDPRDLPVNLYGNDHWLRDTAWMRWWVGERMQRLMPVSPALAVEVRSPADYESGHIPWSVNIPMGDVNQVVSTSAGAWAAILGDHGVSNDIEIVAVDETVTPATTLFFWLLQYLGHEKVSVACEGLDGWSGARYPVAMDDTVIAEPETPIDVAIHPTTFTPDVRSDIRLQAADAPRDYPFSRLWVVAAEEVPEDLPVESYIHVPWTSNLTEDGFLMPAGDLWSLYEQAEVQYFSEIVCYSDDPAEATMTWFVLRLLNFPRVLVYLPEGGGL